METPVARLTSVSVAARRSCAERSCGPTAASARAMSSSVIGLVSLRPVHVHTLPARMADAINAFPATLPELVSSHVLEPCGHWLQQERPDEINNLLSTWLEAVSQSVPPR